MTVRTEELDQADAGLGHTPDSTALRIREAAVEDLERLEPLTAEFAGASRHIRGFEHGRFVVLWSHFLEAGSGAIFLLEEGGEPVGMLGGLAYPEPYSAELAATEMFWFVRRSHRGRPGALRLYWAFERWARAQGCSQIRMVHLADSMPEKLERLYRRWGFELVEKQYGKVLE